MTVTTATTPVTGSRRAALRWLATFPGFPLGGLAAMLLVGPVDSAAAALLGGLLTGSVIGAAQALGLGLDRRAGVAWAVATALGVAVGLAVGSGLVGFGTGLADLAVQGAVTGAVLGVLQGALLVRRGARLGWAWPAYLAAAWAIGWTVTTAVGVRVEDQFTVFGAAGALTVTVLTAVLPVHLARTSSTTR